LVRGGPSEDVTSKETMVTGPGINAKADGRAKKVA